MRAYAEACNYYYDNAIKNTSPAKKTRIIKIVPSILTRLQEADVQLGLLHR